MLGSSGLPTKKLEAVLNEEAAQGWQVVFQVLEYSGEKNLWVECNYSPSCSEYMQQSIEQHGIVRGMKLGFSRLSRCDQHDLVHKIQAQAPVPENGSNDAWSEKRGRGRGGDKGADSGFSGLHSS